MVQFSRIVREDPQFVQIKQEDHVEWVKADAINRWLLMEVLCELLDFVWLIWQCLFYIMPRSVSVKPKMSTLMVACLWRCCEACGRDDTTNPQRGKT